MLIGRISDRCARVPRIASSDAFCSSIVLMLICIMLMLIVSQFSMILSSPILRSISAGSSAANIAAGCGNGMPPGAAVPAGATGAANPGIAMPSGFHMRCMKSSASCGENGNPPAARVGWIRMVGIAGHGPFSFYASVAAPE